MNGLKEETSMGLPLPQEKWLEQSGDLLKQIIVNISINSRGA